MEVGAIETRAVCRFNLRGICRFGNRCWNLHENPRTPQQPVAKVESVMYEEEENACALGACALGAYAITSNSNSPIKSPEQLAQMFGPSTSSVEEAISLIQIAESEEKVCGICFDTIIKKVNKSEQTFGILPNCNHCYCFPCIKKWRQSKEFDLEVSKGCPECRVASDFVYPSKVWLETKEEKDNFIDTQKHRMKKLDCKYFRKGKGKCPFGNKCLYRHALPNGKILDVGPPSNRKRNHLLDGVPNDEILQQLLFWMCQEDLSNIFSDDDEDDDEDDDFFCREFSDDEHLHYLSDDNLEFYINHVEEFFD